MSDVMGFILLTTFRMRVGAVPGGPARTCEAGATVPVARRGAGFRCPAAWCGDVRASTLPARAATAAFGRCTCVRHTSPLHPGAALAVLLAGPES